MWKKITLIQQKKEKQSFKMKIALIYTARSGSSSIFKYFEKLKPEYDCYNEPWFWWSKLNRYTKENTEYDNLLLKDNLFIKSTLSSLPVSLEQIINDFDKVIFLMRRNFKEQLESTILVNKERTYFNHKKRKYKVYSITDKEIEEYTELINKNIETINSTASKYNLPIFYYEDLYFESFDKLFKELNLYYNQIAFSEFLDKTNKYRIGDIINAPEPKSQNTIL